NSCPPTPSSFQPPCCSSHCCCLGCLSSTMRKSPSPCCSSGPAPSRPEKKQKTPICRAAFSADTLRFADKTRPAYRWKGAGPANRLPPFRLAKLSNSSLVHAVPCLHAYSLQVLE